MFVASDNKEEVLNYTLKDEPENKSTIFKKGEYEIDIIGHRVPLMYKELTR